MRSGEFFSRGKFLLSAEYFVLYGAKALAVPLKPGQRMLVKILPEPGILKWETYIQQKLWFSAIFNLKEFEVLESSSEETAEFIQNLLTAGRELQPGLLSTTEGYLIQNFIDFDIKWGLGSSSSLVSNIAYWLDIDPYALFRYLFQGSGYDVYCARAVKPIIYQIKDGHPEVRPAAFNPDFTGSLYFIYSGRKQDSQESVRKFMSQPNMDGQIITDISDLTDAMINASSLNEFLKVMHLHEKLISGILGLKRVKDALFPDFPGEIKSLGAWGGDFIMAGTEMNVEEVKDYFRRKNLNIVFRWEEIVQ